ncbi:MAG: hypothetical protein ABDH20_10170 [Thermus sp.]
MALARTKTPVSPLAWRLRRSTMGQEQAKEISQAWKEALETYGEREEE